MKIAVNTRFLLKDKLEGIGWFTYETLQRITKAHPEHEFFFLFDRPFDPSFIFSDNVTPAVIGPQARHPILWYWWFEHSVPRALKKIGADVFLSTDGYGSLSTKVKQVVVMHDLAFEHYPEMVSWPVRMFYQHYTPLYAKKAERIVTVSKYSRKDIVQQYGVSETKIDVVHNGVNPQYLPLNADERITVKKKYTEGNDYFIYIGSIHPRKNVAKLLEAFDRFKHESNSKMKLVIAGAKGWQTDSIFKTYQTLSSKNDILFTGHLSPEELKRLLGGAMALTYVSKFEGFGIPIVEAMKCEVPVITSTTSSMPEVAGNAALLVDPNSIKEISAAMLSIYDGPDLRERLIRSGRDQAAKFSWDNTAKGLWQSLEMIL